ncbi:MAG: efflux RND transporter permease subunit [Negativicutes bacterium]|nr:efflux RND transporter permease subunit [Negativicutes bacterium]
MGLYTFIKRPVFTTMVVMLLVVFGLSSYPSLGIDLYPDVDFPIVTVTVTWTGTSPEEMETLVTKPIEDAVSSVSNIKTLSSVTLEGFSQTTLEFTFGTDAKMAANDVREKVAGIRKRLPDQIDEPAVQRFDITAQAIVYFSLASDSRSRGETRKIAWDIVKDELQRLDDVADVSVFGAAAREIHVFVDPRKLEAYRIGFQDLFNILDAQNMDTPGGRVREKGTEITVRTLGQFKSVDDVKNIVVASQGLQNIRIKDVADVTDGFEEERTYARTDGTPSVLIAVQKQSGTNTVQVAERVKTRMEQLQRDMLPPDIKVSIVRDSSRYIHDNLDDVMMSLVFGGLLAVIITFLFLQNTRATIIGAIAIPTSIVATFFLMKVMHFTLNNMSLMGLSLAVGILIDDAIVVIENIFRHMEHGKPPLQAAAEGTGEIALAVMATTLSILAVFVPVGNMGEVIGEFFKQFGLTVAFAVAFSLFVAFTLTPMLSAYWLKISPVNRETLHGPGRWIQKVLDVWEDGFLRFRDTYKEVVSWALKRPKKLVALAVLSLLINIALVPFLGKEFQPQYDSGEFNIALEAPAGTSLDKMKELVAPIEKEVLSIPGLETAFFNIGSQRNPVYKGFIGVRLIPSDKRSKSMMDIMDDLRIKFRKVQGLKVAVNNTQGVGRGDARPIQIAFRGPDLEVLRTIASQLADEIRKIPGTADVDISSAQSEPEVQIRLDPERIGQTGVNATDAGNAIQMAFLGIVQKNQFTIADKAYNIRVQMPEESRMSIDDVANLRISGKSGTFVRLGDVAEVKFSSGPTQIDREGRQRQVIVYGNAIGISSGEVMDRALNTIIPAMNLPFGYTYRLVGQAQTMQDSFREISKALILAIVLIYMVLAAEFESFIHPLTIMLSLPFSLVGAILGLLVAGKTINIMSLIGIIMLMGLVTKNAILLIDYTNQLREKGYEITEALVEAGAVRLRPILMTTFAMILGMAPIALGWGAGAELRSSMGVVLVGGLITSTFLTLIIVPLVYLLIDRLQQRMKRRKEEPPASFGA